MTTQSEPPGVRIGDVVGLLDSWFPPETAQSWDAVGLVCGDPGVPVRRVLLAVDPVEEVVAEAERFCADLLVVHHPLLLRAVHSVAADTAKGRVLHRLIRAGCALYVAHTNADVARDGVNEALASLLGLGDLRPLESTPPSQSFVLVTYVPAQHVSQVIDAAAGAGAGVIGDYSRCAWTTSGDGTYQAGEHAAPVIGLAGERSSTPETKVEMVVEARDVDAVRCAVLAAHPYEEPPVQLLAQHPAPSLTGIGRVGTLPQPCTLAEFADTVAGALPATAHGVRVSGDPRAIVSRVAVCGGAGDSLFAAVRASAADVYLTADLRHHPASEARAHRADGLPALVDVSHWASEWPWLPGCADRLRAAEPSLSVQVSTVCTDPWTFTVPCPPAPDEAGESR